MNDQPDVDENTPLFVISVAAELAMMHPQTLRQYDRMGLVSPKRTIGQSRRYTMRNIAQLRELLDRGYGGPVSFEPFAARITDADSNEALLRQSMDFIRHSLL